MDNENLINSLDDLGDFAHKLKQKCREIPNIDVNIFTELDGYISDFAHAVSSLRQNKISYEDLKKASEFINEESIAEFKDLLNNKIDNAIQPQPNITEFKDLLNNKIDNAIQPQPNITEEQTKIKSGIVEIAKHFAKTGLGQKATPESLDTGSSGYTPKRPGKRM